MSKKLSVAFKIFGVLFIIFGVLSIQTNLIIMVASGDFQSLSYIFKIFLNIGYIILGVIFFISNKIDFIHKILRSMIILNSLLFAYNGVSQYLNGNSVISKEDTMLPALNFLGGFLYMTNGIVNIILALVLLMFGIISFKFFNKGIFVISVIIASILLILYIILKIKVGFGLISVNMILLFITFSVTNKFIQSQNINISLQKV